MIHHVATKPADILAITSDVRSRVSELETPYGRALALLNAMSVLSEHMGVDPNANSLAALVTICEETLEQAEVARIEIMQMLRSLPTAVVAPREGETPG